MSCNSELSTFEKEQIKHISRHMEEIAFAVVPREYEDWTFYSDSESHLEKEKAGGEWAASHPLQMIMPLSSQTVPIGSSYKITGLAKSKWFLCDCCPDQLKNFASMEEVR